MFMSQFLNLFSVRILNYFGGFLVAFALSLRFLKLLRQKDKTEQRCKMNKLKNEKTCNVSWIPKTLVEKEDFGDYWDTSGKITYSKSGKYVNVNGRVCLNFAAHNYLGLIENESIEKDVIKAVSRYGIGSCGPRGFYGTIDVHLELEEKLAKFMNTEDAVMYSYGFSTIASAIPAYCKKDDFIFVDSKANFAIQRGIEASRSTAYYFKHNDPEDLERLLLVHLNNSQKKVRKRDPPIRKFLIIEGIYANTGNMCCLPSLFNLARKYKLRIFIDESISFGVLGKTGRGVTEYFNIDRYEIDLIMISMEHALSTVGGFCVGASYVIEHQRLSGLGYCFSASLPPLLTVVALRALDLIDQKPRMIYTLNRRCSEMHNFLSANRVLAEHVCLHGHEYSPVKFLSLKKSSGLSYDEQTIILNSIVDHCIENKVAIVVASYLVEKDISVSNASIRITVNVLLNEEDIVYFVKTLQHAVEYAVGVTATCER